MPQLPIFQRIRAELIEDERTTAMIPLVMIFRSEYAVRVYPGEIDGLIEQLREVHAALATKRGA